MEEFFSILILVIWILFSIYNKNKKKKATSAKQFSKSENSTPSSQKPRSILEQILLGNEPVAVPYEEYDDTSDAQQYEEEEKKEKETVLSDTDISSRYDFNPSSEGSSSGLFQEENDELEVFEEKGIEFNLRQAVIYSEILNRPYAN